jgi:signal transduction histidine kinase
MKKFLKFLQSFSLKVKLAFLITFLVGCISTISVVLSLDMAKNQANQMMDDLVKTTIHSSADHLSDFILEDNRWELYKFLKNLTSAAFIEEAGFIQPDDVIVAHTNTSEFRMGSLFNNKADYKKVPFFKDGVLLGSFILKVKKQSLWDLLIDMFIVQILLMVGFAIVSLVIARYFVNKTIDRLNLLVRNTEAMAAKAWDKILPYESDERDEIATVVDNTTKLMHEIRNALEHEERLKEFYHSILSQVDTLIIIFDQNMQIQFHNGHALHVNILDEKKRVFLPNVLAKMKEVLQTPSQTVAIPTYNNEKTLSLLLRIEKIQNNYVASIIDITTLKKEEQNARISHSLNVIGEISASFAHEIKNLLQPLKLLLPKDALPDMEDLGVIHTTLARMDSQVNDFLAIGKPRISSNVVSAVNPILQEVVDRLDKKSKEKDLKILVDPKESFCVTLDADALHLICVNLLSNAIEAATKNSLIVVKIERYEEKMVHFSFTNQGEPVPEHIRANFFKPFFTTKPAGSGLGLFTVYKIVYLNDGFLEVTQNGKSITFHIYLPLEECTCA